MQNFLGGSFKCHWKERPATCQQFTVTPLEPQPTHAVAVQTLTHREPWSDLHGNLYRGSKLKNSSNKRRYLIIQKIEILYFRHRVYETLEPIGCSLGHRRPSPDMQKGTAVPGHTRPSPVGPQAVWRGPGGHWQSPYVVNSAAGSAALQIGSSYFLSSIIQIMQKSPKATVRGPLAPKAASSEELLAVSS